MPSHKDIVDQEASSPAVSRHRAGNAEPSARLIAGRDIGADLARAWGQLQRSVPYLDSPYFCPEYVMAVANVRDDVEVVILEDAEGLAAVFPFQRGSGRVGHPVGGRFSDFQAVIARDGVRWTPHELLRAAGLRAFRFDHLLSVQEPFRKYHWSQAPSPFVDLPGGFEGYRAERREAGSREVEQILYKTRKAERRLGPVRFELHSEDDEAFETLLRWKSEQLRQTGQADELAKPWVRAMLTRIRQTRGEGFAGILSTLHMGDRLAAVHLGMRSTRTLHWWVPAYDRELASASPGQVCFLELARAAASLGVTRIDLGKGSEPYKTRLMNGAVSVAQGTVDLRPMVGGLQRGWHDLAAWARESPLRKPFLGPVRWVRRAVRSREDS